MRINSKAILLAGSAVSLASAFTVRRVAPSLALRSRQQLSFSPIPPGPHPQQLRGRSYFGFLNDLFEKPQVSSNEDILQAFKDPKAVVIDVRSPPEITSKLDAKNWINAPGTPFDNPMLKEQAEKLLPDKNAPVILYCASGKRSQKATDILKEQGYQKLYNAGGIGQIDYLPMKSA